MGALPHVAAEGQFPFVQVVPPGSPAANLGLVTFTARRQFDDPQTVSTEPVGEVTLTFSDCSTGAMTYRIDTEGLEGEIPLTRLIPGTEGLCQQETGSAAAVLSTG